MDGTGAENASVRMTSRLSFRPVAAFGNTLPCSLTQSDSEQNHDNFARTQRQR